MKFKTLKIQDQSMYESYRQACPLCMNYLGSELNFQNLMTWKVADQIEYAIIDEKTFVIKKEILCLTLKCILPPLVLIA